MCARIGAFGVVLFLLTVLVGAQTGQITGVVRDTSGVAMPGVSVAASSPVLIEKVRVTTTDANGRYQFTTLPPGTYKVTFTLQGFKVLARENLVVTTDFTATANAELMFGDVRETVVVNAAAPATDVVKAKQLQVFSGSEIKDLPTSRNVSDLYTLVPGIASDCSGCAPGITNFNAHESGAVSGLSQGRVQLDGLGIQSSSGATSGYLADVGNAREVTFTLSGALGESQVGGQSINVAPGSVAPGYVAPGYVPPFYQPPAPPTQDSYAPTVENTFRRVSDEPLSTFSIDVDTASYANVRRFLNNGALPPRDAVRVEEMVNYFHFDYPQPKSNVPFSVTTELVESPWNPAHRLALIGLQGRDTFDDDKTPRNLVFLIDVSGSMSPADRLPLVKSGMRMLTDTLQARDRVAIVTYAGYSGLALPSTPGDRKDVIHGAIDALGAGGSTNGAAGIKLAYEIARQQFAKGGVNRVILATDGDFNVGVTSHQDLLNLIETERQSGVFLSVLGVGTGNLKDSRMEMLADKGNGNYAYLDSIQEAQRVLVHEAASTLVTIAKDVKIQVEFNPQTVAAYRLIGYENRLMKAEEFNDDRKDAGEIGSGHSVTALYEIIPVGADIPGPGVDPLKYQQPATPAPAPARFATQNPRPSAAPYADELMTVKLRYKEPDGDTSKLISTVVRNKPGAMTGNIGFASAVAEFGLLLRGSQYSGSASYDGLTARARKFRGTDADGYRAEFIKLSEVAKSLRTMQTTSLAVPAGGRVE